MPGATPRDEPILLATQRNHVDVVDLLLKHDAKADVKCLFVAASEGHLFIADTLMKAGVDVNETTEEGRTALHGAAVAGHVPLIRHLLAAGSDLDIATTRRKLTALHWACRMGHIEAVRALLARGADPMLKNFGDMTASDLAHKAGHTDIVTLLADFSQRDPKAVNEPDLIRG